MYTELDGEALQPVSVADPLVISVRSGARYRRGRELINSNPGLPMQPQPGKTNIHAVRKMSSGARAEAGAGAGAGAAPLMHIRLI